MNETKTQPAMIPREKILRDALETVKEDILSTWELLGSGRTDRMKEILLDAHDEILWALKQADEIKNGPSEEDKEILIAIGNMDERGITIQDKRWLISKLKQEWGM